MIKFLMNGRALRQSYDECIDIQLIDF